MIKRLFILTFIYYLPAMIWAGIIFYLSSVSSLGSGTPSFVNIFLRKTAHAAEFGIMALLIFRIIYFGHRSKFYFAFFLSMAAAFAYAASDETHQLFVSDRSGNPLDVFIDFTGILFALWMMKLLVFSRTTKKDVAVLTAIVLFWFFAMSKSYLDVKYSIEKDLEQKNQIGAEAEKSDIVSDVEDKNNEAGAEAVGDAPGGTAEQLPPRIVHEVPFTSQAPFKVWDELHEETCEEASVLMAMLFQRGEKSISPQKADQELKKMVNHQLDKYGKFEDSNMEITKEFAEEVYGMEGLEVVYDFTKDRIKRELAAGNIIIIPVAGRELGNPNFTPPGPLYHALVLKGYDGNVIISNDPGTRNGESYRYSLDVVYGAIHDFPGEKSRILQGRKAMIVVPKNQE